MPVRLTLLGGLGATLDGVEQDWLQAKKLRAALLTYLALERRVSREALTAFFWPERDEEHARHALRQTLYTLREALGEEWVTSGPLEIGATPALESDAADFDAAVERGDPAGAANLYRGPFLAGVNLIPNRDWEDWVDGRRAHYERAFRAACRSWADGRMAMGDVAGALVAARRWAAPDPLDDEAQHRLIELLAAAGERAEAVRHYDRYQRLLEAEELEPLDETRALVERLRKERTLPPTSQRAAVEVEVAPPPPPPPQAPPQGAGSDFRPATPGEVPPSAAKRGPRSRRWGAAAVVGLTLLTAFLAIWSQGVAPRGFGGAATALDSTTFAVLPVAGEDDFASRWNATQLVHDAVAGWSGISLVDHFRVREVVAQDPSEELSLSAAQALAARLGAGRFLFGDVHPRGDSAALSLALYATETGKPVRQASVVVAADGTGAAEGVERLTEDLLVGQPPRAHAAAHRGTRSVPAAAAMVRGVDAVWNWELGPAREAFREAVEHDPAFAQGWLWLALVGSWSDPRAPARWAGDAQRALASGDALSPHDQGIAAAVAAQGRSEFPSACARWRGIAAGDSLDFVPWYGLGTCLRSDDVVRPDPASRSGWSFRTSQGDVLHAYRHALELLPAAYATLSGDGFDPSRSFLFLSPLQLRRGRAAPPDTTTFVAYPTWNDSLSFLPVPASDSDGLVRTSDHAGTETAVRQQRETFMGLAQGWTALRPASASALETLALALEMLGSPTAMDTLRKARSLAADDAERVRVATSEVWVRLKLALPRDTAGLRHAAALADTLLGNSRGRDPISPALAGRLAALAALRGRAGDAAAMARIGAGPQVPGALAQSAPALLAFAALGGPPDSIRALEEQVAAVYRDPGNAPTGRATWEGRPATLAFPDHRTPLDPSPAGVAAWDPRFLAVVAYWRGDRAEAHRLLDGIFDERARLRIAPEAVTIDAAFTEAALLDRLEGTRAARSFLGQALSGVRTLPNAGFDVARAGTLVRAVALMAELEARVGDTGAAREWARAASILWAGGDPHLQAALERVAGGAAAGR